MSRGTNFIQTNKGEDNLTLLTKAWATKLPCFLVWKNEWVCSKLAIDIESFTVWPIVEREKSAAERALHISSEFPSNTEWRLPSSTMNLVALRIARASKTCTNDGWDIFSDNATITSPLSFHPPSFKWVFEDCPIVICFKTIDSWRFPLTVNLSRFFYR